MIIQTGRLTIWCNGYATEAAAAVLDYGLHTLELSEIAAESAVENVASVRVMEEIDMQFEAFGQVRGRKTVRYRQGSGRAGT
jgi:RimJ/RimL family protein N-acetyltransferase